MLKKHVLSLSPGRSTDQDAKQGTENPQFCSFGLFQICSLNVFWFPWKRILLLLWLLWLLHSTSGLFFLFQNPCHSSFLLCSSWLLCSVLGSPSLSVTASDLLASVMLFSEWFSSIPRKKLQSHIHSYISLPHSWPVKSHYIPMSPTYTPTLVSHLTHSSTYLYTNILVLSFWVRSVFLGN